MLSFSRKDRKAIQLGGELGENSRECQRKPVARTCVALEVKVRTLDFILSEMRSHWRIFECKSEMI